MRRRDLLTAIAALPGVGWLLGRRAEAEPSEPTPQGVPVVYHEFDPAKHTREPSLLDHIDAELRDIRRRGEQAVTLYLTPAATAEWEAALGRLGLLVHGDLPGDYSKLKFRGIPIKVRDTPIGLPPTIWDAAETPWFARGCAIATRPKR